MVMETKNPSFDSNETHDTGIPVSVCVEGIGMIEGLEVPVRQAKVISGVKDVISGVGDVISGAGEGEGDDDPGVVEEEEEEEEVEDKRQSDSELRHSELRL